MHFWCKDSMRAIVTCIRCPLLVKEMLLRHQIYIWPLSSLILTKRELRVPAWQWFCDSDWIFHHPSLVFETRTLVQDRVFLSWKNNDHDYFFMHFFQGCDREMQCNLCFRRVLPGPTCFKRVFMINIVWDDYFQFFKTTSLSVNYQSCWCARLTWPRVRQEQFFSVMLLSCHFRFIIKSIHFY